MPGQIQFWEGRVYSEKRREGVEARREGGREGGGRGREAGW